MTDSKMRNRGILNMESSLCRNDYIPRIEGEEVHTKRGKEGKLIQARERMTREVNMGSGGGRE